MKSTRFTGEETVFDCVTDFKRELPVLILSASAPLSHDGTDSPAESDDIVVVLNNFKSRIIKVKVSRSSVTTSVCPSLQLVQI